MATTQHHLNPRGARVRALLLLVLAVAIAGCGGIDNAPGEPEGRAEHVRPSGRPTILAAFPRESYARGSVARLVITDRAGDVSVQLFHAGTESSRIGPRDLMRGSPVTAPRRIGVVAGRRVVRLAIGPWPSGLYYARLTAPGGRIGYAPFVLRPRRLGEHRIAVVLPTFTWQAYNFRDDDGDGDADTWYDGPDERSVKLGRPYENRGVPPHYKNYDQPFLRWLIETGRRVDVLSDSDLHRTTGRALARAYDLIVFPGHHEYVTEREYDAVEGFRDRGGDLAFLSANNFFWRVDLRGGAIWRIAKWRELGRPEAALIGVQYIGNDEGESRGAWIVRRAGAASWIFAGTAMRLGSKFSNGGIEIDKTSPASPAGTRVLAEIPNLLGPGMTGQMTYYETRAGARVFAAGAFSLAAAVRQPPVKRLLANLLDRMGRQHAERVARVPSSTVRPAYGWPVKPFDARHPVRGFFGDPRIGGHGETQFHFGVDVSAPNGTAVYATRSGIVSFIHGDALSVSSGDGIAFEYWHVVPKVRPGQRVEAYRTILGHVEAPWAHVHFSERRNGVYLNPLRPGAMGPYRDDTAPSVRAIHLRPRGGRVDVLADVADETPMRVPPPWERLPVMPAVVRWRLVGGGSSPTAWASVVDFRHTIPGARLFSSVYAPATRQNHAHTPGLYRLRIAEGIRLEPGRRVQILVTDTTGNRSSATRGRP